MLIFPVGRSPDWRRPPVITLLLILINTLIYFGIQANDDQYTGKAYQYYSRSSLTKIELPRYVAYLKANNRTDRLSAAQKTSETLAEFPVALFHEMNRDAAFTRDLLSDKIILPSEEDYSLWKRERTEFERLRNKSTIHRFGFKTAEPSFVSLVAHLFLHGSFDHLLGNMALLFIVGYLVEESLGKSRFLIFYLLTGFGGGLFDLLFNDRGLIPGIGASGAVSGVMAMFVALYGLKKIRFFYWIWVYFDFFRAPAIIVLPFWMAKELYQFLFNHGSNVNYLAHLGGFFTGGLLIFLLRTVGKFHDQAPEPEPEQAQQQAAAQRSAGLAKVDKLLNALRIDEACRALRRLAFAYPQDAFIVERYFKVARHSPASEEFHHAAGLVFALPSADPFCATLICETFNDYLKLAKPGVRLSVKQLILLVKPLTNAGQVLDAERLTGVLVRRAPQEKALPGLLLLVAKAAREAGKADLCSASLLRLQNGYPDSQEAQIAAQWGRA